MGALTTTKHVLIGAYLCFIAFFLVYMALDLVKAWPEGPSDHANIRIIGYGTLAGLVAIIFLLIAECGAETIMRLMFVVFNGIFLFVLVLLIALIETGKLQGESDFMKADPKTTCATFIFLGVAVALEVIASVIMCVGE